MKIPAFAVCKAIQIYVHRKVDLSVYQRALGRLFASAIVAMPFFEFLGTTNGHERKIKSPSAILFLFFSSIVSWNVVTVTVEFILTAIRDMMRLISIGEFLNDMIRITDFSADTVFAVAGDSSKLLENRLGMTKSYINQARKTTMQGPELSKLQELGSFYVVDEDTEVILPRLSYRFVGNFMAWTHIRLLMKQLGARYRQRLDIFVSKRHRLISNFLSTAIVK